MSPKVSVVLPVYNGMPWMPVAAQSILRQTFSDFELLVVDDGSTDGSGAAADTIAANDRRVRVLRHPGGSNKGLVPSLNLGIAEARGRLIARIDADDLAYPERLEKQVECLDAEPDVVLVGAWTDVAKPEGTTLWRTPANPHLARWTLLFENCFVHSNVMFRMQAAIDVGGYAADAYTAEDYDLWCRLVKVGAAKNIAMPLGWFNRIGENGISSSNATRQEQTAQEVSRAEIRRLVPDADPQTLSDLVKLVRFEGLNHEGPDPGPTAFRVSRAADLLGRVRQAFFRRYDIDRSSARLIRGDVRQRLLQLRWAVIKSGGIVGTLARLHRPWETSGAVLRHLHLAYRQ